MKLYLASVFLFLLFCKNGLSQESKDQDRDLIQFSGVVVSSDDLQPIPFTSIIIKHTNRGTISDYYGYFSFVAQEKDTIVFSSIGYKTTEYIIPDTLTTNRYSLIQMLVKDTVQLEEVKVYPWPSKEEFKKAFLNLDAPSDDYDIAQQNLAREKMNALFKNMPMDASMNYTYQMQQYQSQLYYLGQYPPNTLMNPIAWAKFIRAWQNGELKIER